MRETAIAAPPNEEPAHAVPLEILKAIAAATAAELESASALLASASAPENDEIWISARPLARAEERLLLLAGTLAGWAVVREPGESTTPELLLWARPTLLSGSEAELVELLGALDAEAPRWRRERWLARRLSRLRTLLVEEGGSTAAVARALARFDLGAAAPRVLSFPRSGW